MKRGRPALLCGSALLLTACSAGGTGQAFDALRDGQEGASRERTYTSLSEVVAEIDTGRPGARPAEALVVGRVASVEPGIARSWDVLADGERVNELRWDDPATQARTFHLHVQVREVIDAAPGVPVGDWVTVGISFPPETTEADVNGSFIAGYDLVLFLTKTPVFDYHPQVWAVTEDAALVGIVADDGSVSFPLLDEGDPIIGGVASIADLRSAAEG